MQGRLGRIDFSAELLAKVQDFHCGDQPWEQDVADWIKNPERALAEMGPNCRVWLYVDVEGPLVGYGSLGRSMWRHPDPSKSDPVPMTTIPWCGIRTECQGKPEGASREDRYSTQMLRDLIHEALQEKEERFLLGLFVHTENTRAAKFYEHEGFRPFGKVWTVRETGWTYQRMILDLREWEPG